MRKLVIYRSRDVTTMWDKDHASPNVRSAVRIFCYYYFLARKVAVRGDWQKKGKKEMPYIITFLSVMFSAMSSEKC